MASVSLTGKAVIVSGLKSRPELNFLCGVAEKLDDTSGRFAVRLPVLSKPILLKPDNLEAAPDAVAAIAACCEAEHAAEVKERVRAASAGESHEDTNDCVLDLDTVGLQELPMVVGTLSEMRELWLAGNALSALPPSIGSLVRLRSLDLDGNRLSSLPASIGSLTALETLYCNNNALVSVPEAIGSLRALRELRLNGNLIGAKGVSLGALPEAMGRLEALRTLWLAANRLDEVPAMVLELAHLEELDLADNELVALPKALSKLKGLASLELTSNPKLVWPPPDVAAQGAAAVRTWLANAEDREPPVDLDANIIPLAGTQWGTGVPLYAHEPEGSMHMPLPQVSPDGHGGGEFIFPATSR